MDSCGGSDVDSIRVTCKPREDLLAGTFNPEIFTASLSQVIRHYRGSTTVLSNIYTDPDQFFTEGTYPTVGLRTVLDEVFARLGGNNTVPAIHRLETSFGGGKTHALIACTHIAFRGRELADVTSGIANASLLPEPGEVSVVGIAGDEIEVQKPKGAELVPYTLWGEIAFQVGGEDLYRKVEADAESYAAPGKSYFGRVFGDRKVLLMLDELAQYATRLEAARPNGGRQLAAFLMALHGYARTNSGIAVLLTLAGAQDAFADQTKRLAELVSAVRGEEVSEDTALSVAERGVRDVTSVVSRDAVPVIPVQAAEISRILAKRLFERIDPAGAEATAEAYVEMYAKNVGMLPEEATRADYKERLVAHYPLHPTFIGFLNNRLSTVENFQGTRGVLRVLALAVRRLWLDQRDVPMMHVCHLDLRDARTVAEILGRTGSNDLLPVLNADVGGVDTKQLEGGRSNAELADLRNPHPAGHPMYEYAWQAVFLHSLVDRDKGLGSNLFGITEQDAVFTVSFPTLTPHQVVTALKEIEDSAYYLRFEQGRYYASLDPSINIALARIRKSLNNDEITTLLDASARKVVSPDIKTFHVEPDVSAPEHIPDEKGVPVLAVVSLGAEEIDAQACVTTKGQNRGRVEQNMVLLLVPETVLVRDVKSGDPSLFSSQAPRAQAAYRDIHEIARWVLAMRKLRDKPQDHGIAPAKLAEKKFDARYHERENSLQSRVTEVYSGLWFPSASGQVVRKEIKTAGGEGGASTLELVRRALLDEGELITSEHTGQSHLMSLGKLFFEQADTAPLDKLRECFRQVRRWPMLEAPTVFEQIVRAGVSKGQWCLFRMGSDENLLPDEFHSRDTDEVPYSLDLTEPGYALVTVQGANQRGWTKSDAVDLERVKGWVKDIAAKEGVATVSAVAEKVAETYGEVEEQHVAEAVGDLVRDGRLLSYKGEPDQQEKPDLITKTSAALYNPDGGDVVVTLAKASERGWITEKQRGLSLTGKAGAKKLLALLRRIGGFYSRGATSKVDSLELTDLVLPKGGTLRVSLYDVPPESMKLLGELFEVLDGVVEIGENTEGYLDINEPDENCPFVQELEKEG